MANNHFGLTLDTLAPSGTISIPEPRYARAAFPVTITADQGATHMFVWLTQNSPASEKPAEINWEEVASSKTVTPANDGLWYANLLLLDDVLNESAIFSSNDGIVYDTAAPTTSNFKINGGATVTSSVNVTVGFSFADASPSSGCKGFTISGDCTTISRDFTTEERTTGAVSNLSAVLTSGDTTKTLSLVVTDNAGNTSSTATQSILLDQTGLVAHITVKDSNGTTLATEDSSPVWTNTAQKLTIELDAAQATDWVSYKIFSDINEDHSATGTEEPAGVIELTPEEIAAKKVTITKYYLTSGDSATKNITAKLYDQAGNMTQVIAVIKADYSAPTVSVASDKVVVSKVAGFNSFVLTPTVNAAISGAKEYQWYMNDVAITESWGAGTGDPTAVTVPSSIMLTEGAYVAYTFTLKVTDNAGNSTISAAQTVYLDTVAPSGTITVNDWYNLAGDGGITQWSSASFSTTITHNPSSGIATMQAWVNTSSTPGTAKGSATNYAAIIPHSAIDETDLPSGGSATVYLHVKYTDNVGNAAIISSRQFGVDTVAPALTSIAFVQQVYRDATATVSIVASDTTSGLFQYKVFSADDTDAYHGIYLSDGNKITRTNAAWQAYTTPITVSLAPASATVDYHGSHKITLIVRDTACNQSADEKSATCELDLKDPRAEFTLWNPAETEYKKSPSPVRGFIVHLTGHEDGGSTADPANLSYKIWGDFNTDEAGSSTATPKPADYTPIGSWETGKDYKKLGIFYATNPNGPKTINVEVVDNAGRVFTPTAQSWVFDNTAPEVTISNVDHNRISKVHSLRKGDEHAPACYADEAKYRITPNEKIIQWKTEVRVLVDSEWVYQAIGTTHGSSNMTGTVIEQGSYADCMIRGADYEEAIQAAKGVASTTNVDGAYYVVVSVMDEAGTWSEYGSFEPLFV